MRRVVNYTLTEDQFFEWFQKNALVPTGSQLRGIHHDFDSNAIMFRVENERFKPVADGAPVPRKHLEYGDPDGPKPL